jgi:anti-anti-sigma factor
VGSLSKTSVAIAAGARSQFANLVAALFCLLTLIFLTPLFRNMPQPTLAAIVIAAMLHLTKPHYLRELFVRSRWSFMNAVIVIGAELTLGVMHGIALGTEAYRDVRRHLEARTFPGLLIWRVGGDLFFASVGQMERALKNSLADIRPPIKHVLLDMSSVNFIDVSACDELITFVKHLQSRGITIAFARVRDNVRQDMQLAKIETVVGSADFYERITDGIRAWQRQEPCS